MGNIVEIRFAVQSFLQYLAEEAGVSKRVYRAYQHEMERLSQFLLQNGISSFDSDVDIQLLEQFYLQRTRQLSSNYAFSLASKHKRFFDYLHARQLIGKEVGVLFPFLAKKVGSEKRIVLLEQVRQLEKEVLQAKRLGRIKERFSAIKQEIIHLGQNHPAIAKLLFSEVEQNLGKVKTKVQAINTQHLSEIFQVGSFLEQNGLHSLQVELARLAQNTTKLGREALKTNTLFENKQEKDGQFFQELNRRLARLEQLAVDLQVVKKEHAAELSRKIIKNLFPVIDGLENAQTALLTLSKSAGMPQQKVGLAGKIRILMSPAKHTASQNEFNSAQWREGLEIIRQRLLAILAEQNVQPMKCVGTPFNPHYHIAVQVEHRDDVAEGVIVREQLVGYCQGNQAIRHAEVVVAKRVAQK